MTKLSLPKSSALADLTDTQFRKFSIEVKQHTGVNMELHKKNLLSNRLKRRIKALNLTDYEEYYSLITGPQSKKELPFFIDEVTTHETYFYRGDKSWKYYTEQFLPKWKEAQGSTPLKIWCAVASTGEEPYTIAILSEEYKVKNKEFSYQIVASDISGAVIKKCKEAHYSGRSIEKMPLALANKYFNKENDGSIHVDSTLVRSISFLVHDLLTPMRGKRFDIVFLRNVMIYFEKETKEKILKNISDVLSEGGLVIVGESESLIGVDEGFEYVEPSVYRKKVAISEKEIKKAG